MIDSPSAAFPLIAVDWGTTNRRAYLIDASGAIVDRREDNLGILGVPPKGFGNALCGLIDGWRDVRSAGPPVLMSGMVGSRQGWIEATYAQCPVDPNSLATNLVSVPDLEDIWIVPGVCLLPAGERRDVMRGEEIQVFGALAESGQDNAMLCLPGTHNKWVRVEGGRLTDFVTAMTGEVYRVMCDHSILGALIQDEAPHDVEAFARAIEASGKPGGLLIHLFELRADGLFGTTPEEAQASYLSGLLIGHEIRDLSPDFTELGDPVLLVGSDLLSGIYGQALDQLGIAYESIDVAVATVRGLTMVWEAAVAGI